MANSIPKYHLCLGTPKEKHTSVFHSIFKNLTPASDWPYLNQMHILRQIKAPKEGCNASTRLGNVCIFLTLEKGQRMVNGSFTKKHMKGENLRQKDKDTKTVGKGHQTDKLTSTMFSYLTLSCH